jgi:hypothetical protein
MDFGDILLVSVFGAMAFASLAFALRSTSRDREDCVKLALVLIIAWSFSNIGWLFMNPLRVNSAVDVLTLGFCLFNFRALSGWRAGFVLVVVLQVGIDIYRELAPTDFTFWALVLNATFGLQTVIVALGASNGWYRLSRVPGGRRDPV